jgi:selenocysteine lyase/cysteine desulfurase
VLHKGYELLGERTLETGAGIVSFRKPGVDAAEIVRKLSAAGISVAPRAGWVRTSPHFYIPPSDIDRLIEELP